MNAIEKKQKLDLYLKENGLLYIVVEGKEVEVYVKQCFPWSHPEEFLSLRDKDDNEVCLIDCLGDLASETQEILRRYLDVIDFVLLVEKVIDIEEDVELRQFRVKTIQGERVFQTKLEDWPEVMDDGSILIEDLAGDLFKIKSLKFLDEDSKKILSTYVA